MDVAVLTVRVGADISGVKSGLAEANAAVSEFAGQKTGAVNLTADGSGLQKTLSTATDGLRSFSSAATQIGGILTAAFTLPMAAAIKAGADFESKLNTVANNTTMTTAEIAKMKQTVIDMGRTSAAPLDKLAEGFMHIMNFGFKAADAPKILHEAMKSAVSTNSDAGKTAELLAQIMHQFHLGPEQAARSMNLLHMSAAQGNMTLEQFVASGGKAFTMAANLKVPIEDVSAAFSALTRNGFSAATASTQVVGMLTKITNPSAGTQKLLMALSNLAPVKAAGIDLGKDFSVTGIQNRTLPGVLADVKKTAELLHIDPAQLFGKVIPATRGGIGATALATTAAKDFAEIRKTGEGKGDPVGTTYARSQETLNVQIGILRNNLTLLGADIQKILVPILNPLVKWAADAAKGFSQLPAPIKQFSVMLAGIAAVAGPILVVLGSLAGAIASLVSFAGLFAAGGALAGIGAALGPIALAIGAVIAAVALLAAAWRNNWGDIQGKTAAFVAWIRPYLAAAWEGIKTGAVTAWNAIKSVMIPVWNEIKAFLMAIWPPIHDITIAIWNVIVSRLQLAWNSLRTIFAGTWESFVTILKGVWNVIAGVVKLAWAIVAGIITVGLNVLTGHWHEAWENFKKYLGMAWDGIKQALTGVLQIVVGLLKGFVQILYNIGSAIVQGLANGIKAGVKWVVDAAKSVANSAVHAAKSALGIQSPSKEFHQIGDQSAAGLAQGLMNGTAKVKNGAIVMVDEMHKAAKNRLQQHKTEMQKEMAEYAKLLLEAKAQLKEAQGGGDTEEQKLARQLPHVSQALRENIITVRAHTQQVNDQKEAIKQFREEMAKTAAEITRLQTGNKFDLYKLDHPNVPLPLLSQGFTQQQRKEGLQQGQSDHEGQINAVTNAIAGLRARYLELTAAKALLTASTQQEKGSLSILKQDYSSLSPDVKILVDQYADLEVKIKTLEAAEKAHTKAQQEQARQQREQAAQTNHIKTLWKDLSEEFLRAKGALEVATGTEAKHTAQTATLAEKYKELGGWGAVVIRIMDQMKAKTEAATQATKEKQKALEADKIAQEKSQQITDRLTEAQVDMHREWTKVLHTGTDYESMLGRLNLASKTLTAEQQDMVRGLVKQQQTLDLIKTVVDGTRGIVQNFFSDLIKGGSNFFSHMIAGFTQMFEQIAVQFLTNQAMQGLMGLFGGAFGGFFGGGGIGTPPITSMSQIVGVSAFAGGGDFDGNSPLLVGEEGPELIVPRGPGRVLNSRQMGAVGSTVVNMTVMTQDARSFRQSRAQMMHDAFRDAARASRRNGGGSRS